MYCSNCGAKCTGGARFCIKCGQRLTNDKDEFLMEERAPSKIIFLATGFFFALHGVFFLYCFGLDYSVMGYSVLGDISHFTWLTGMCFLLFACAILLLLRKIKPFSIVLLIYSIWNIIWYGKLEYRFGLLSFLNYREMLSFFDIALFAFSYGMLVFLAIAALRKENRLSAIVKKIWYIPGILFCLDIMTSLLLGGIISPYGSWRLGATDIVCTFIEIMLSGWCLTHSYKK